MLAGIRRSPGSVHYQSFGAEKIRVLFRGSSIPALPRNSQETPILQAVNNFFQMACGSTVQCGDVTRFFLLQIPLPQAFQRTGLAQAACEAASARLLLFVAVRMQSMADAAHA